MPVGFIHWQIMTTRGGPILGKQDTLDLFHNFRTRQVEIRAALPGILRGHFGGEHGFILVLILRCNELYRVRLVTWLEENPISNLIH